MVTTRDRSRPSCNAYDCLKLRARLSNYCQEHRYSKPTKKETNAKTKKAAIKVEVEKTTRSK
jgi:hypothetical protein